MYKPSDRFREALAAQQEHGRVRAQWEDGRVLRRIAEMLITVLTQVSDRSQAYNKTILSVGYVGFFTAWAFTSEYLRDWQNIWSVFLMSVSLTIFIGWTIISMFVEGGNVVTLATLADRYRYEPLELIEQWQEAQRQEDQKKPRRYFTWWCVFVITIILAMLATLILMYGWLAYLLSKYG